MKKIFYVIYALFFIAVYLPGLAFMMSVQVSYFMINSKKLYLFGVDQREKGTDEQEIRKVIRNVIINKAAWSKIFIKPISFIVWVVLIIKELSDHFSSWFL